jgi:1,4-dihydroxy-2-naphthoyl-CoA hydrolase
VASGMAPIQPIAGTWSAVMGIRFVRADATEVVAELDVASHHLQAFGLVHGGVYAGLIESMASLGATLAARPHGRVVVGLENHSSFVHAVRSGQLHGRATPVHVGKTMQLWEATIRDDDDRIAASGRVRLLCTEPTR